MTMAELMEETEQERFVIDSDAKALWAIRKIKEAQQDQDKLVTFYQEQIRKATQEAQFRVDSLRAKLEDYAATMPMRETKTQRVYALPGAKLVYKKPHAKILHDDPRIIEALKASGKTEYIKTQTVEKLDWSALKKAFQEAGEVVDGISVEIEPESFEVRIEEDE